MAAAGGMHVLTASVGLHSIDDMKPSDALRESRQAVVGGRLLGGLLRRHRGVAARRNTPWVRVPAYKTEGCCGSSVTTPSKSASGSPVFNAIQL